MNDTIASNIVAFTLSHAGSGKVSVLNPSANSKRPRPIVTAVDADGEDLAWDPIALEQFTFPAEGDGHEERAGDSFAVVRPGHARWPLGHVSDVYKPTSHRVTAKMVAEACAETVKPFKKALMSGHGYRVVHDFHVLTAGVDSDLHGLPVTSRLSIVHDHTGLNALRAKMVIYVGKDTLGSFVGARAIHVANNPEKWRVEVEAMVSRSMKAQSALMTLLQAADAHVLTEADKALLVTLKVPPPSKDGYAGTLLDSCVRYFKARGGNSAGSDMTWGVYERRLSDDAIRAMVMVLGAKQFGVPLDLALGGHRYGGKHTDATRAGK